MASEWKYESRSQRRRRMISELQRAASAVQPYVESGDYGGARQALSEASDDMPDVRAYRAQQPPQQPAPAEQVAPQEEPAPKKKAGGFMGALDRITPEFLEPVAKKSLTALDAPRKYVGGPLWSVGTGITGTESRVDPETGLRYRGKSSYGDWGRGLVEAVTRNPLDTYREGRAATDERLNDPNLSKADRVLLMALSDPLTYVGPGAVRSLARALPASVRASKAGMVAGPVARTFEAPGSVMAGATVGGALATDAADRMGFDGGGAQFLAAGIGGIAGAGAASRATRRGLGAGGPVAAVAAPRTASPPSPDMVSALQKMEPTGLVSSLYGRLPFLRKDGVGGLPRHMINDEDAYEGVSLIALKKAIEDPKLPASARVSNAFWKGLGALSPNFRTRLDDPRVRYIGITHRINDTQIIPEVANVITSIDGKVLAALETAPSGAAMINGKTIQYVNPNGVPVPGWTPIWADIAEHIDLYPEVVAALPPGVVDAMRALSRNKLGPIHDLSKTMGIRVEGEVKPSANGFYMPRGRPKNAGEVDGPTAYRPPRNEGARAGSTQERQFASGAEGIAKGKSYPSPIEALRETVEENLRQQNSWHAANLLNQLEIDGRAIGASRVPQSVADELGALRKEIRPDQRELRGLKRKKAVVDRDVRLESRNLERMWKRHAEIRDKMNAVDADAATVRTLASEAFVNARQVLDDTVSAAREFAQRTARLAAQDVGKRRDLDAAMEAADGLSTRLAAIERETLDATAEVARQEPGVRALNALGTIGPGGPFLPLQFPVAAYKEATAAWSMAKKLQERLVADAKRVEARFNANRSPALANEIEGTIRDPEMTGIRATPSVTAAVDEARAAANARGKMQPGGDAAERSRGSEITVVPDTEVAGIRESLAKVREQFGDNMTGLRTTSRDMASAAADEASAAANARGKMLSGRDAELQSEWARRGNIARRMVGEQTELGQKIAELTEQLDPKLTARRDLLKQVAEARSWGRKLKAMPNMEAVHLTPLQGIPFPRDLANAFNKYIAAGERGAGMAVLDLINNAFRALGATADASRQMTVGLLGQADRPGTAIRGIKAGIRSARDPKLMWDDLADVQARWKAKGIDVPIEEAVGRYGIQIAASETSLAGMAKRGTLEERMANLPIIKQADALYSAPGNIERLERFYETLNRLRAEGKSWESPQARAAAANIANLVSGRASRGILAPFLGEEVSARIAFAGRFTESQFEVVANAILSGGIEGYEARRALLRLTTAGVALTAGINHILGEETDYDPTSGNFMRIRIAGRDASVFGPWDSLAKGAYAAAPFTPGTAERFARGKLAPLPAFGYDASRGGGENPVGEPLTPLSMLPVPFGVRDIVETAADTSFDDPSSLASFGLAGASAVLGVKNSALTPSERLDEIAREIIDPETGKRNQRSFYDSSPSVKSAIKEDNPTLWAKAVSRKEEAGQRWEEVKTEYIAAQARRDTRLFDGGMTLQQWRDARGKEMSEKAGQFQAIYADKNFEGRSDKVLQGYFDALDQADVDGVFDYELVDSYLASLDDAGREHIAKNVGVDASPVEKLYKRLAKEYYAIPQYQRYDADVGREINALAAEVGNRVKGDNEAQRLRALRQLEATGEWSPDAIQGVRRSVLGLLREARGRAQYVRAHPEISLLTGRGSLTPEMTEAIRKAAA